MFLNTFNAGADFNFSRDHSVSFGKPAVEAELRYLDGFDASDVTVEESGSYIVLEGSVQSTRDLHRALRVASEIVGAENVICQLAVIADTSRRIP